MVDKPQGAPWGRKIGAIASLVFAVISLIAEGGEPITGNSSPSIVPNTPSTTRATTAVPNRLDGPVLPNAPTWSDILRTVLLTAIPDKFEDLSQWDKTNEVFGGLTVQQRGFNIRVSERKQKVNHGAWQRYKIELINPAKTLSIAIEKIKPTHTGGFQFEIRMSSKLRCRGDFEHWVLGVKGLNFTVISEADVQMIAACQIAIRTETNPKSVIPDLVLDPRVNEIKLFLSHLDVRRIGEIRGDIAEGIGDASRHYIENLLQAQEGRVVTKANEAIEKKRDSLRITASKLW